MDDRAGGGWGEAAFREHLGATYTQPSSDAGQSPGLWLGKQPEHQPWRVLETLAGYEVLHGDSRRDFRSTEGIRSGFNKPERGAECFQLISEHSGWRG